MSKVTERLRHELHRITASEAKRRFAYVLERALAGEVFVISKHSRPQAVTLSWDAYQALIGAARGADSLDELTAEFDALVERMQTPESRDAFDSLFERGLGATEREPEGASS